MPPFAYWAMETEEIRAILQLSSTSKTGVPMYNVRLVSLSPPPGLLLLYVSQPGAGVLAADRIDQSLKGI